MGERLVCPVHFRDVYQTFDTLFDFRKTAVVSEIGDTSVDAATLWVTVTLPMDLHPTASDPRTHGYALGQT